MTAELMPNGLVIENTVLSFFTSTATVSSARLAVILNFVVFSPSPSTAMLRRPKRTTRTTSAAFIGSSTALPGEQVDQRLELDRFDAPDQSLDGLDVAEADAAVAGRRR